MVPELLLLVGQGSERFFSSENKTKQKNPGSNVKSLLNLFGADDLSNWNGFWKQSWELGWGMGHLLLGETRKNRDRSLTRRRMEGSLPAGNMVPINKTLFSSILLKSHKTSEDFTANCQVTLQTVRSQITKKKKKTDYSSETEIPAPNTPWEPKGRWYGLFSCTIPMIQGLETTFVVLLLKNPLGVPSYTTRHLKVSIKPVCRRIVKRFFFPSFAPPFSPFSQRSSFWRETNERNQEFSLCEWQQWQLQFNSTTWSPFRLKQKVSFSI